MVGAERWDGDSEIYLTFAADDGRGVTSCKADLNQNPPITNVLSVTPGQDTDSAGVEGFNTYYVQCFDAAGNASRVQSDTISIDLTAPTIDSFIAEGATSCSGSSCPASVTITSGDPDLAWTTSDAGSGVARVEVWRATGVCTSGTLSWTQLTSASPEDGSYSDPGLGSNTYCYGIHVVDAVGHCRNEDGTLCSPGGGVKQTAKGQIQVTIDRPCEPSWPEDGLHERYTCNLNNSANIHWAWNPGTLPGTTYELVIDDTSNFSSPIFSTPLTTTSLSYTTSNVANKTRYYGRVRSNFPITTQFKDTFTTGSSHVLSATTLNANDGDVFASGYGWIELSQSGSADLRVNSGDFLEGDSSCNASEGSLYRWKLDPDGTQVISSADYEVSVIQRDGDSNNDYSYLIARAQDGTTFYAFRWNRSNGQLYRVTPTNVWTALGSKVSGSGANLDDGRRVSLRVQGLDPVTLSVYNDSSLLVTVDDTGANRITAPGWAGVGIGRLPGIGSGGCGTQKLDDFEVQVAGMCGMRSEWSETREVPVSCGFTADFQYCRPNIADDPNTVSFVSRITEGVDPISYAWTFGDGGTSSAQHPDHTFGSGSVGWWNDQWTRRRRITFNNSSGVSLTNFPVLIKLHSDRITYGEVKNGGADIRFVDSGTSAGGPVLPHEIESWNSNGDSYVWVNVPQIDAGSSDSIWMYYGNSNAGDFQQPSLVWDSATFNLVHHVAEQTGVHMDSTGKGNNSSEVTVAQQGSSTALVGRSDMFSGSHRVQIPDASMLDIVDGQAFTLEAVFRKTSNDSGFIVGKKDPPISGGYQLAFENTSGFISSRIVGGASMHIVCSSVNLNDNQWHYVALRYSSNDVGAIFVDGALCASQSNPSIGSLANAAPMVIGEEGDYNDPVPGGYHFVGYIDEIRFSSTARTSQWIEMQNKSLKDAPSDPFISVDAVDEVYTPSSTGPYTIRLRARDAFLKEATHEAVNVDIASVPSCEFLFTNVTAPDCGYTALEWNQTPAALDYDVIRKKFSPLPETAYSDISSPSISADPDMITNPNGSCSESANKCSFTDTSVERLTSYRYYIQANAGTKTYVNSTSNPACSSNGGTSICPLEVTVPNCKVTGVTNGQRQCGSINVTWNTLSSASSYRLYRSLSSTAALDTYEEIASSVPQSSGATVTFTDSHIIPGITYYYYVVPRFASGPDGEPSDVMGASSFCYRGPLWEER